MPLSLGKGFEIGRRRVAYQDTGLISTNFATDNFQDEIIINGFDVLLGEDVVVGNAGYLLNDVAYLADYSDNKPAQFIYLEGGSADDVVKVNDTGIVATDYTFTVGELIMLGADGDLTQTVPTSGIYQILGLAISIKELIINIKNYFRI
jgi:hypothetical protein